MAEPTLLGAGVSAADVSDSYTDLVQEVEGRPPSLRINGINDRNPSGLSRVRYVSVTGGGPEPQPDDFRLHVEQSPLRLRALPTVASFFVQAKKAGKQLQSLALKMRVRELCIVSELEDEQLFDGLPTSAKRPAEQALPHEAKRAVTPPVAA